MRAAWLSLLMITAAFVGCIGQSDDTLEPDDATDPNTTDAAFVPPAPNKSFLGAIETDHAHNVPELHTNTSGFTKVGYTNFEGFYPPNYQGGWGEVDIEGDLAAISSGDGPLGATLVDISDPSDPKPLSYTTSTGADFDARITDGAGYLVVGCQSSAAFSPTHTVTGDCQEDTAPTTSPNEENQIAIYDISDPKNPEPVGTMVTDATHNLWTQTINGTIYIFTNAVEIIAFEPDAPEGEQLEMVANVQGTHDVTVSKHPITGDWLLYTGSPKDNSMAIYEINDPASPSPLVKQIEGVVGWHEQAVSPTVIDGRVIAVGGGETMVSTGDVNDPRQQLFVIDVTDPTAPEMLSSWQLPIDLQPPYPNYRYSAHNVHISPHGQVISAWYHGGAWAFDLSTQERQEAPVTLGFYQPHELYAPSVPPAVAVLDPAAVPLVWGPQWTDDGHLVLGDMYTGVYVLEPEWGLYPTAGNATAS